MSHTAAPSNHNQKNDAPGPVESAGREVSFWFGRRQLTGYAGESIAKALFRNGIRVLSHSVKYGRPRGIHCGRGRCSMCLVEVDGISGVKSCLTPLAAGMRIRRQNYGPFYSSVMNRIMRRVRLPAGFYYRMFTGPRFVRVGFMAAVRRMAGVGKIDHTSHIRRQAGSDPFLAALKDRYDVVVVGAGVSGMSAALSAAGAGADVLVIDEYAGPGGHSIGSGLDPETVTSRDRLVERMARTSGIELVTRTTAQGFYPPDRLMAGREGKGERGGGLKPVAAAAFVFATGAQDLIPLFENNDLPGVFGARGLRLFLERDHLIPGRNAVVYGTGADLSCAVRLLRAWDISVSAVVDAGPGDPGGTDTPYSRTKLVRAEGRDWISRAVFENSGGDRSSVPCDLLCIAVPGQPSFELAQQAGFRFGFSRDGAWPGGLEIMTPTADASEDASGPRRYLVGEASGRFDVTAKIKHASETGAAAARRD